MVGIALTWPLAAATGQMVRPAAWGAAEWAMLAAGVLNALAYSGYVWLVGRAGSVFASQIAYLVTGFGVRLVEAPARRELLGPGLGRPSR